MSLKYSTGDQVPAADLNGIMQGSALYAATVAGTDTYAITVTPAPTAYNGGDTYAVKIDVANTGPCTLNVNALGAKNIKQVKSDGSGVEDPPDNTLLAGDIAVFKYDGTQFLIIGKRPSIKTGSFTRDVSTASGTQAITGVGFKPKLLIIIGAGTFTAAGINLDAFSAGFSYAGENGYALGVGEVNSSSTDQKFTSAVQTSNVISMSNGSGGLSSTVQSLDNDGFTLSHTKSGSPSSSTATFAYIAIA